MALFKRPNYKTLPKSRIKWKRRRLTKQKFSSITTSHSLTLHNGKTIVRSRTGLKTKIQNQTIKKWKTRHKGFSFTSVVYGNNSLIVTMKTILIPINGAMTTPCPIGRMKILSHELVSKVKRRTIILPGPWPSLCPKASQKILIMIQLGCYFPFLSR